MGDEDSEIRKELSNELDNLSSSLKEMNIFLAHHKENMAASTITEEKEEEPEASPKVVNANKTLSLIDKIVQKYNGDADYEALISLADEGMLMELDDILNNLEIERKTFEDKLAKNPIDFISFYRQRLEMNITYLYDTLQDLEAESIGQFGQRLPGLFKRVREKYTDEELPTDIKELVDAGNDINKLISATVQLSLKLWAAHDLGLYILVTLSDKRNNLINEIKGLEEEKKQLEIQRDERKKEIEEEMQKLSRDLDELQRKREGLAVEIENLNSQADKLKKQIKNGDEDSEDSDEESEDENHEAEDNSDDDKKSLYER